MDRRIRDLLPHFESVWATGWGERANEHLVHLLSLPGELEVVDFAVAPSTDGSGHWKLDALTERAGAAPAAWTVAHHPIPVSQGGPTSVHNYARPCEYHHHLFHSTNWTTTWLPNGKARLRKNHRKRD